LGVSGDVQPFLHRGRQERLGRKAEIGIAPHLDQAFAVIEAQGGEAEPLGHDGFKRLSRRGVVARFQNANFPGGNAGHVNDAIV
jgi:hypothetical protein